MFSMFRASNKYRDSKMCVHVTHTHQRLKPELKSIWDDKRTASLRGHTGREVAWDFTLERMNLEVQTLLGNNIAPERIGEVIRVLNSIRDTKDRALDAFGISGDELSEANGIAETDLLALVGHIRSALGFDGNDDALASYSGKPRPSRPGLAVALRGIWWARQRATSPPGVR